MSTVAVYMRTSSAMQAENNDVDSQRLALQVFFATNNWEYGAALEFVDSGESGATDDRKDFQRLRECINRGEILHLVVYDLDRIARNVDIRSAFVKLCTERACRITDMAGDVDVKSPGGLLLERIKSALAEFQRAQTAARTVAGIKAFRAKGERWGGARQVRKTARKGKKRVGARRFTDEEEQAIAREVGSAWSVAKKHGLASPTTVKKYREKWLGAGGALGAAPAQATDAASG